MKRSNPTVPCSDLSENQVLLLNEIQELEIAVIRNLPEGTEDLLQAYFDSELPNDLHIQVPELPDYRPLLVGMDEEEYSYHANNFQVLDNSIQKVRELLLLVRSCDVDTLLTN